MYLLFLCYLLTIIYYFSDWNTFEKYGFNMSNPLRIFTSFFIHLDPIHYYCNVGGIFFQSFFIEFIFSNNLYDLLLLAIISHILGTLSSYYYYNCITGGASTFIFVCLPILISSAVWYFLQKLMNTVLQGIVSMVIIGLFLTIDICYSRDLSNHNFKVSHISHFVAIMVGYVYWHFFLPPSMYKLTKVWFEGESPSLSFYWNFHILPFIFIYLYKSKTSPIVDDRYRNGISIIR
jgi:hypothetical protein